MALVIENSAIVQNYIDGDRTRTLNYRGSLLSTTAISTDSWASGDDGSIFYVTLIPFTACIRSIRMACSDTVTQLAFKIGIGYQNTDGTVVSIKDDLVTVAAPTAAISANIERQIWPSDKWSQPIFRQLCESIAGTSPARYKPIEAFEPYYKERYGVLYFKSTTKNTAAVTTTRACIDWVEISPSETPLVKNYISASA